MDQQSKYLSIMLKKFAPAEYAQLKKSADARRWYTDTETVCTLSLTTMWKLLVELHRLDCSYIFETGKQ